MYQKHNITIIISTTAKPYPKYCMVESDIRSSIEMMSSVILVVLVVYVMVVLISMSVTGF
jgi:hypothetical protein